MRLVLAIMLVAAIAPTALGAAVRPQVRLVDASPASVAGVGFQARERVVVRVTGSSGRLSRAVVTSARGAFVARFAKSVAASGCHQIAIVAVGANGDRAAWKSPPKACGPPPQPIGQ
jgi:hypothetical protein